MKSMIEAIFGSIGHLGSQVAVVPGHAVQLLHPGAGFLTLIVVAGWACIMFAPLPKRVRRTRNK